MSKFDISSFSVTGDMIYVDFQTSHFGDFEHFKQFKVDSCFANFRQGKIDPIRFFTAFGQVTVILRSFGKACLKDNSNPLCLIKIQDLCA